MKKMRKTIYGLALWLMTPLLYVIAYYQVYWKHHGDSHE